MSKNKLKNKQKKQDDLTKFVISGLVIIMTATLLIYFIWALLAKNFMVSFHVDAIVGVVSLIVLIRMLMSKYKIIKEYTSIKDYFILDFLSLVLCILIKVAIKIPFDFSLVILTITYFISKKRFEKLLSA